MSSIRAGVWALVLMVGCTFAMASCGLKLPPVPPSEAVPARVTGLSARLTEQSIVLTWSAPERRKNGSPLDDFSGFRVSRASYLFSEECPGCPERYIKVYDKAWRGVGKDSITDRRVQLEDTDLAYGRKYVYAVEAMDGGGLTSEMSEPIAVYWDVPPAPPSALSARAGDGLVKLGWQAPDRSADGSPLFGPVLYDIYRSEGNGPLRRLNKAGLLSAVSFDDTTVVNGRSYSYKVRAVRVVKTTLIEGADSPEVTAVPNFED